MAEPSISKSEAEKALRDLRLNDTETPHIDSKETISLKSAGDHAAFIRHIAALANTGQKSYLIIGVENKTWVPKGLPDGSPLIDVDSVQQQMNQMLANRVDPPLQVCYRTFPIDGVLLGFVCVVGDSPPYIISIEDSRYGGSKTKGKESYVYRGAVYVRREADSIVANRQSMLLDAMAGRRDVVNIIESFGFVATIIGVGIGLGASTVEFGDPYAAAILGFFGGALIGWLFHKRLIEAIGRPPRGLFGRIIKYAAGPIWGAALGALAGYMIISDTFGGVIKNSHPILAALFMGPTAVITIALWGAIIAFAVYKIVGLIIRGVALGKSKAP